MNTKQPTSLVKFASAETAVKILSESKLRWSAPFLFDDPFELDHRSNLDFDNKKLLVSCVKQPLGLIFSRDDPRGMSPLVKAVRRWRAEDRFSSEEEAQEVLTELLNSMVNQRLPEIDKVLADWRRYSRRLRILCMTDSHESAASWQRYAENHTGVAFRIACGDDSSVGDAMQVEYTENRPEITCITEQMEILMNQAKIVPQETFAEKFIMKSKMELKEKEWRFFKTMDHDPGGSEQEKHLWYDDAPINAIEIRAVYFGARINSSVKEALLKIIAQKYKKAKLFQAIPRSNRYEMEFERMNPV